MSNAANSSTNKIYYLPGDPSKTPLEHDEYVEIMRPYWKQRKRLQRAGECKAPAKHVCACDCVDCPYSQRGNTIDFDTLVEIGEEIADPYAMEDAVADHLLAQQLMHLISRMDQLDQLVLHGKLLHSPAMTDRECAAFIERRMGIRYSHQAVAKRYPKALERLRLIAGIVVEQ